MIPPPGAGHVRNIGEVSFKAIAIGVKIIFPGLLGNTWVTRGTLQFTVTKVWAPVINIFVRVSFTKPVDREVPGGGGSTVKKLLLFRRR